MNIEENSLNSRKTIFHDKVKSLLKNLPKENPTRKQLAYYQEQYNDSISYLSDSWQKLAFIGNVGIGKTTAICHLLGLLNGDEPILSTGSGRTTLCEVEIVSGPQLRIEVRPHSTSEVKSYLVDFAQYLHASTIHQTNSVELFKLSAEVERALRNMLDLKIERSKNAEGQRISIDNAKTFASNYQSIELLIEGLFKRIDFSARNQVVFTNDNETEQNEWISSTFKLINNCTHPHVGLAKSIKISVPDAIFDGVDYALSVIDTKGVDQTVNRADLDGCLNNNRTVSVLCCRFNDAPDKTMSGLLKLAKDAGLSQRLSREVVLLVLDREHEAEQVIDIDEPVGDKDEGRDIRNEQIINDIKHTLQLDALDVIFFDVKTDDPQKTIKRLSEKASGLREQHNNNIVEIEREVSEISREIISKSAQDAMDHVKSTLGPWLEKAQASSPCLKEYFSKLISEIDSSGTYAASVRASVNRRGEWHNLDYYQILASGARGQVVEQIGTIKDELVVLINNMLSRNELQPAYALLIQLKKITEKRLEELYKKTFEKGKHVYAEKLLSDSILWSGLINQWGMGPGYKGRVSGQSEAWFKKHKYSDFESSVTNILVNDWNRYVNEVKGLLGAN